ncbi:hypothetical protein KR222_010728 [Zaprionus bogoriensis]|nr:hypothetical protein KR222_010728 [Zaprionus bogoriensis]
MTEPAPVNDVEAVEELEAQEPAEATEPVLEQDDGEEAEDEDVQDEQSAEDPFELLDESEEDNEEQRLMYREYLDLIKQIDCQNALIDDMKERMQDIQATPCATRQDRAEFQRLRNCIDQENIKLHTMMNRIIQLQNNGSARLYSDIELAITAPSETNFLCRQPAVKSKCHSKRLKTAEEICAACCDDSASGPDSDSDTCCT